MPVHSRQIISQSNGVFALALPVALKKRARALNRGCDVTLRKSQFVNLVRFSRLTGDFGVTRKKAIQFLFNSHSFSFMYPPQSTSFAHLFIAQQYQLCWRLSRVGMAAKASQGDQIISNFFVDAFRKSLSCFSRELD
jgi:hypothetical protein